MQIGKILYVKTREEWRSWLEKNHTKETEIWFIFYRKAANKPSVSYNDAVEEALCFGWIDSIVKGVDKERFAQKFSKRKPKSNWSGLNIERMRRLIRVKKMTAAGLKYFDSKLLEEYQFTKDILKELKKDKVVWQNFAKFPASYKRIRISFIEGARNKPEEFKKRLRYFFKMTSQNKTFGMIK